MRNVLTVDVSRYEERLNGDELKAGGIGLIIAKCSSGTHPDRSFIKHGLEAARVGIPFAAYHWGDPTVGVAAQVDFCLQTIRNAPVPVVAVALDIEQWWLDWSAWNMARFGKISWASVPRMKADTLNGFYYSVYRGLSKEMETINYTSRSFVLDSVPGAAPWLATTKLWLAHYGRQPRGGTHMSWEEVKEKWLPDYAPLAPAGTPPANIIGHQFSGDRMLLPGLYDSLGRRTAADVNVFDDAWVAKVAHGAGLEAVAVPSQPAQAKFPYSAKVVSPGGLNVRSAPFFGPKIGVLPNETYVDVLSEMGDWAQIGDGRWVAKAYLSKAEKPVSSAGNSEFYAATVNSPLGLNIRLSPGGTKVGVLPHLAQVQVWKELGGWAQIAESRWVSASYLRR